MKQLITVAEQGDSKLPVISITEEARESCSVLLAQAGAIETISLESTRDRAIRVSSFVKSHLKEVEKLRTEIKAPYLEIGRRIDEVAKAHVKELTLENTRLNRLVGDFEFGRQTARRAAEAAAERARKILEPEGSLGPQSEETRASALSAALDAEEMAVDAAPPAGGAMRQDWKIEVLDIHALYEAHPQCVKMTPDILSIKDLLKKGIAVAGVLATLIHSYNARATTTRKAIDV